MKKSYLMIAAAAALFTACANNEPFVEKDSLPNSEQKLSFSAFADKVTKGTNSTALNDFYTVFAVYGWKTVNNEAKEVFKNTPNEYFTSDAKGTVVYDADGEKPSKEWAVAETFAAAWYYENVRYWDKTATNYQFFAIAPYDAEAEAESADEPVDALPTYSVAAGAANFTIGTSDTPYDISDEKNLALSGSPVVPQANLSYSGFIKDYMIADKKTVTPTAAVTAADVQLQFHHILAKLNVKIQKADSYKSAQELKVTELKIGNLAKTGYFVYNTSMTTNGWSTDDVYARDITTAYSLSAETNYSGKYWIETLMFPQTATCKATGVQSTGTALTDMYLYIKYQIGEEIFEAYYDFANIWGITTVNKTFEFKQGSEYNLTLTVGPEPIHFDATVTQWAQETAAALAVN